MNATTKCTTSGEAAWARRKTWSETWARSDTERWLDARSAALAAWARTIGISFAGKNREPTQMGSWLRIKLRGSFDTAHTALAKLPAAERETVPLEAVLPPSATKALDSEPPFATRTLPDKVTSETQRTRR